MNTALTAEFVTFSVNTAEDGFSNPLDGTDVYVLTASGNGLKGSSSSVTLTDDILGQPTWPTTDFVSNYTSGSAPTLSGEYDVISQNGSLDKFVCQQRQFQRHERVPILPPSRPPLANGGLANNGGPTDTIALTGPSRYLLD